MKIIKMLLYWFVLYNIKIYIVYKLFEYLYSIPIAKISKNLFYGLIFRIPYYQKKLERLALEKDKFIENTEKSTFHDIDKIYHELPENGIDNDEILSRWNKNNNWSSGKISGTVYNIDPELDKLILDVIKVSLKSNPLHSDLFPNERQARAEIINFSKKLFHGDENTVGVVTSGGTESLLMTCLSARNRAFDLYNITTPEIIIPESAHAAFDKAGDYFGIKIVRIPLDSNFMVILSEVKLAINNNTIMIIGSYPNFPQGIIDPIDKLSQLVLEYNGRIALHVDACLGGFMIPFMEKAGHSIPFFDFTLPGVTSLSADTHKFGNGPKGASVLLYKNSNLRKYQYWSSVGWMGGIIATPGISGSHSGSIIGATWAVMMKLGMKGFIQYTKNIMELTRKIIKRMKTINELEILGNPQMSVLAFTFKNDNGLNIYDLQDEMKKRKWFLNELQNPAALHICITSTHTQIDNFEEQFITDLEESIRELKCRPNTGKNGSTATLYGEMQKIPKEFATQFVELFFDIIHQHAPKIYKQD